MSLNGLDDVKLKEAHDAAVAEPGGWFLLKYISRDEVELAQRGNGGIVEIRNAIATLATEDEAAPLFGFLRYRRRNVLIKYVPETCSRLVQARVMVHFNAVTDRFSPHDTSFPISSAKELRDTTLSSACSLHTASGSTSSSTSSLRRRRLMEIAEDEEEDNRKRQSTVIEERPGTAKTISQSEPPVSLPQDPSEIGLPTSSSFQSTISSLETFPPPPREPAPDPRPSSPIKEETDEAQPRTSSQSLRPDLFGYSANGRPKVKLGPRPSLDVTGRPHTSGAAPQYRPVSTLPVGLKIFSNKSPRKGGRPQSQYILEPPSMTISPPSAAGPMSPTFQPSRPHTSGGRPPPISTMRPLAASASVNGPKTPTMTPEKARLMKALEMRKKQMVSPPPTESLPPTPRLSRPVTDTRRISSTPKEVQDTLAMLNDMAKATNMGVSFDSSSTSRTEESDAPRSDSYPPSPICPSEHAESTRASSISESTDETMQETSASKAPISGTNLKRDEETPGLDGTSKPHHEPTLIEEVQVEGEEVVELPSAATEVTMLATTTNAPDGLEEPESQEIASIEVDEKRADMTANNMEHSRIPLDVSLPEIAPALSENSNASVEETSIEAALESIVKDGEVATATEAPKVIIDSTEVKESELNQSRVIMEEPPIFAEAPANQIPPQSEGNHKQIQEPILLEAPSAYKQSVTTEVPAPVEQDPSVQDSTTKLIPEVRNKVDPPQVEVDGRKVPRSKFSSQNLRAETSNIPTDTTVPAKSPIGSTLSNDSSEDENESNTRPTKRKKRRGPIEPIRTDIYLNDRSGHDSDAHFSSDDDLMDELQLAVVQEAKPISVSKSPISPVFPKISPKKADGWRNKISRATSNPLSKGESESPQLLTPPAKFEPVSRSVSASAAYLNRISQESAKPMPKKVTVGSGISQRIKAFEKFGAAPPPPSVGTPPLTAPSFFSVRKASGNSTSKSPSIAERANSLNKNTPSPPVSRDSSPQNVRLRSRSGSIKNRAVTLENNPISHQTPRSQPESISVTAHIVRDSLQPIQTQIEPDKNLAKLTILDLKQSQLVIDHQKPIAEPTKETIAERRLSFKERRLSTSSNTTTTTTKEKRSSVAIIRDFISDGRASFSDRRRSINLEASSSVPNIRTSSRPPSIKSSSRPPSTHTSPIHSRSLSINSRLSSSSTQENFNSTFSLPLSSSDPSISPVEEKGDKTSRASRMLRRMSASISSGRKNIAHAVSPTVREESEPMNKDSKSLLPSQPQTPSTPNVNIGDVNVQFPDSLLWKRRSMLLDNHGTLILAPALTASGNGKAKTSSGATRRFHLSEFRPPVIPDIEMQELPNSVLLDFFEGGGLQIACEDRSGQGRVLEALQEAHDAWAKHGQ